MTVDTGFVRGRITFSIKIWRKRDLQKDTEREREKRERDTKIRGRLVVDVIMDRRPDERRKRGGEGVEIVAGVEELGNCCYCVIFPLFLL